MGNKFSAAKVNNVPDKSALKTLITGGSGVGKTWFASTITNDDGGAVFFIPIEEGLKGACPDAHPVGFKDDRDRWIIPHTIQELHQAIDAFAIEQNALVEVPGGGKRRPYRHLAIDSLTGIERLVNDAACGAERARHMEDKEFKKVWNAAFPYWEGIQKKLDDVRRTGVNIWLIAHSKEAFDASQSTGEVFRKWDIMLRGTGQTLEDLRHLWRSWADNVFFITKDITVSKGDKTKRAMARLGGRVLITRETGSIYAKSRLPIPDRIPATWNDLQRAVKSGTPIKPEKAREQVLDIMTQLGDDDRAIIETDLAAAKSPTQIAAVLSRAQGMLALLDEPGAEDGDGGAEPPPPALTNGAAPLSDEERLRAIDGGRA